MDLFNNFNSGESKKRNVDIVFCIDGTGSMVPFFEKFRKNIDEFVNALVIAYVEARTTIKQFRYKFIIFRDYEYDEDAMQISRFYNLDNDKRAIKDFLDTIYPSGGGDGPENGLEALYYAFNSDFVHDKFDRQIVCLFTDNDALPLNGRKDSTGYPKEMAKDLKELKNMWLYPDEENHKLRERNKRLVILAPKGTIYHELHLNKSTVIEVEKNNGLDEVDLEEIAKACVKSATDI